MKDHNERTQFSLYWQSLKDSPNESPELLRALEHAAWNAWKTRASMDAQAQQEPRADMTNQQVDATLGISRLIIGLPTSDFEVIQKFAEHMGGHSASTCTSHSE